VIKIKLFILNFSLLKFFEPGQCRFSSVVLAVTTNLSRLKANSVIGPVQRLYASRFELNKLYTLSVLTVVAFNPSLAKADADSVIAHTLIGAGGCALAGGIGAGVGAVVAIPIKNIETAERVVHAGAAIGCAAATTATVAAANAAEVPSESQLNDNDQE
jgi:hypothetical protein